MQHTNTIGYLLQHLSTALARQSEQVLQERLGLGFSQFKILMALQSSPQVRQNVVADALGQTEASISRQIKLMQERGLLTTTVRPTNRREHIAQITPKGIRITEEALNVLNNYHSPMFELLNEKERQRFLESLMVMHSYACQPSKSGACHKMIMN